jgi:hypothetical protein
MRGRAQSLVFAALVGCGSLQEGGSASEEASSEGIDVPASSSESGSSDTGSSSSSGGLGSESSGDASAGDPSYPPPSPVDELGDCPDGFLGPITFDGTGWGCIPACNDAGECPAARSGDAPGECATNPLSSATPCTGSEPCEIDGEMCGNAGMKVMACLLPPSHCILRCENGETCPDTMTCTEGVGICQYIP